MDSDQSNLPKHVAVVMDGNGRWAKARFLPRLVGHHRGVEAARKVIKACSKAGVKCLTLFAFSSENWRRPADEVSGLMSLFMTALEREAEGLIRNQVRLNFIGDRSAFSPALQDKIYSVEQQTQHCTGLQLLVAANYGGRWDIVQATQQMCLAVQQNTLNPEEISETTFTQYLSTAAYPEPDLFIRTGGEQRISNFLLWQLAYTEFYFSNKLWPEFDEQALQEAFNEYAKRQRRFGMTDDQLQTSAGS